LSAQNDRFKLGLRQNQRRHVVLGGQQIAEARLAHDWHPRRHHVRHIAVHSTRGHLQLGSQCGSRDWTGRSPKNLDDLEEAFGAAHRAHDSC
jgi:hypothetical protein